MKKLKQQTVGVVLAFSACVLFVGTAGAQDEQPRRSGFGRFGDRGEFGPRNGFRRWNNREAGENRWSRQAPEELTSEPLNCGFLFVEGKYVPLRYEIKWADEQLTVNGQPIAVDSPIFARRDDDDSQRGPWRNNQLFHYREFRNRLQNSDVIAVNAEGQAIALPLFDSGLDFLRAVVDKKNRKTHLQKIGEHEHRASWTEIAAHLESSAELTKRAQELIAAYDGATASNTQDLARQRFAEKWSYPLTVLGMALAVVAMGHLLSTRPEKPISGEQQGLMNPESVKAVVKSILLVVALSAMDLIWTIMAWQSGQMKELNPLGSRLVSDPASLAAFKGVATVVAVGLLFALRRHYAAQTASWWACLVCTILAFRWLTFNSMFTA